jgi:hypothetical protein
MRTKKIFLAVMVTATISLGSITGCSSSVTTNENIQKGVQTAQDTVDELVGWAQDELQKVESNQEEIESETMIDSTDTDTEVVTNGNVTDEILKSLKQQLEPISIVLDESWTETLNLTSETQEVVQAVAAKIAESSTVKITQVDLQNNTVTYEVRSPKVEEYLVNSIDNIETTDSVDICRQVIAYLETADMNYSTETFTVSTETSGKYCYLKIKTVDLVNQVTGGFYDVIYEFKDITENILKQ